LNELQKTSGAIGTGGQTS